MGLKILKGKTGKTDPKVSTKIYRAAIARAEEVGRRSAAKIEYWKTKAGHYTTSGGSATEDIIIAGVKVTDKCTVGLTDEGAVPVKINTRKCGDGKITVTFSADPSTDHQLDWSVTH